MSQSVGDILDEIDQLRQETDEVSLGDVLSRLGHRTEGTFLLLPALVVVSPLGAIPTVPTIMAVVVLVVAVQMVVGSSGLWLPGPVRRRALDDDRIGSAVEKMRGPGRWLDRNFGGRLPALTSGAVERVAAAVCALLAVLTPPLELLPFGALIPMAAVAAFGLAITLGDGLLMILAFVGSAAAFWGMWTIAPI